MRFIMLAKKYRLTKRGSFAYVYRKGGSVRGKYMTLIYVPGKDVPRLGLSVNNKVGHAVVRNKLKRRMREVMRLYLSEIKPCQAIFAARSNAGGLTYDDVKQEMTELFQKSGLLSRDAKKEN